MKRFFKITAWILGIIILLIVSFLLIVRYFYADEIKQLIVKELNKNINTKVTVKDISFSVFSKFPDASIVFYDVVALSSENFEKKHFKKVNTDTLISAENIYLQFNIFDILREKYIIKAIEIENGKSLLLNDKNGGINYEFWKSDTASTQEVVSINLKKITIKDFSVQYINAAKQMYVEAETKKVSVSGKFTDLEYEVSTYGGVQVNTFKTGNVNYLIRPAFISAGFDFNNYSYRIKDGRFEMGNLIVLVSGNFKIDPEFYLDLKLEGKDIDVKSFISLLPENIRTKADDFNSSGRFFFNGNVSGAITKNTSPKIEIHFGVDDATVKHKSGVEISQLHCKGWYSNGENQTLQTSFLRIDEIKAQTKSSIFTGSYIIENFEKPKVEMSVDGSFNLNEIYQLASPDSLMSMEGTASAKLMFSGNMTGAGEFTSNDYQNAMTQGEIQLQNVSIVPSSGDNALKNMNGSLAFKKSDLQINNLSFNYNKHDFELKGYFRNVLEYLLQADGKLIVDANISCDNFDVNTFLGTETSSTQSGFALPTNISIESGINIKSFTADKFKASQISGDIIIEENQLFVNNLSFNTCGGSASASGSLEITKNNHIIAELSSKMNALQFKELFQSFNNFNQTFLMDKHLSGSLSATVNMKSEWDENMKLIEDKLLMDSHIKIENGELIKFEPMQKLSDFIAVSELKHIKFNTLETDIAIKKRIIYIPKTDIKSSAINLEISGEHSFDNKINYRLKVMLSEILAKKARTKKENEEFGVVEDDGLGKTAIYLLISGTTDNFTISYDTKSVKQTIKENIQKEKETVKELLREEFGTIFGKKDTSQQKKTPPADKKPKQGVIIEWEYAREYINVNPN